MNDKHFIDSSFLIALALDKDTNKEKAIRLSEVLTEECYISDNIIDEVVTVVNLKGNYTQAIKMYHFMIDNFKIINEHEIVNFNEKSINIFEKFQGKLSFTDSAIIVTMLEYNIDNLVSFDKEFGKEDRINVIGIQK